MDLCGKKQSQPKQRGEEIIFQMLDNARLLLLLVVVVVVVVVVQQRVPKKCRNPFFS